MQRGRLPFGEPSLDLFLRHFERKSARFNVEDDSLALPNRGNRPAHGSFGRDVPNHQPARGAAEAAISHQGDFFAQTFADNGSGHAEHHKTP